MEAPRRQVLEVRQADGLEQQLPRLGDAAAEDEQLRVEHGAEAGAGLAEPVAELAERGERARVARATMRALMSAPLRMPVSRAHVGERLADAAGVGELVGHALQRAAGTVLLDAAVRAASARQAAGDDAHVADLGAGAEAAAEEPVVADDRAADAGADREDRPCR